MTQNPKGKKLNPSVSSTWASSSSNQSVLPVSYPYKHSPLRINLSGFQLVQSKDKSPYNARPHRNHFHPLTSLTHARHKGWLFLSPFLTNPYSLQVILSIPDTLPWKPFPLLPEMTHGSMWHTCFLTSNEPTNPMCLPTVVFPGDLWPEGTGPFLSSSTFCLPWIYWLHFWCLFFDLVWAQMWDVVHFSAMGINAKIFTKFLQNFTEFLQNSLMTPHNGRKFFCKIKGFRLT